MILLKRFKSIETSRKDKNRIDFRYKKKKKKEKHENKKFKENIKLK